MMFPSRERRHPCDVFPGMVFFIVDRNVGPDRPDVDVLDGPYTVICNFNDRGDDSGGIGGRFHILLLGPDCILRWREQELGWIRRIIDPVWEERHERECAEARKRETQARLLDAAMALGA